MSRLTVLRPVVTEKSLRLAGEDKFTFAIPRQTNRLEVASFIASAYKVTVVGVDVASVPSKPKGRGRRRGWRKAIVTVKKGDRIPGFELPITETEEKTVKES